MKQLNSIKVGKGVIAMPAKKKAKKAAKKGGKKK